MTNKELRQYFIKHCGDKISLQAYLDRLSKRSDKKVITTLDDSDFDEKIKTVIREQIERKR